MSLSACLVPWGVVTALQAATASTAMLGSSWTTPPVARVALMIASRAILQAVFPAALQLTSGNSAGQDASRCLGTMRATQP